MDTAIFIARRIAAQSILLSEEAAQKLASILIRTELKKGALFLSEGEVCTQLGYVYKGMVRQFYFKNKKELTEHFASEDNIFICIESFLRQRPANLLVEALEPRCGYARPGGCRLGLGVRGNAPCRTARPAPAPGLRSSRCLSRPVGQS